MSNEIKLSKYLILLNLVVKFFWSGFALGYLAVGVRVKVCTQKYYL